MAGGLGAPPGHWSPCQGGSSFCSGGVSENPSAQGEVGSRWSDERAPALERQWPRPPTWTQRRTCNPKAPEGRPSCVPACACVRTLARPLKLPWRHRRPGQKGPRSLAISPAHAQGTSLASWGPGVGALLGRWRPSTWGLAASRCLLHGKWRPRPGTQPLTLGAPGIAALSHPCHQRPPALPALGSQCLLPARPSTGHLACDSPLNRAS